MSGDQWVCWGCPGGVQGVLRGRLVAVEGQKGGRGAATRSKVRDLRLVKSRRR
jgi:hypothetical protein